jgi:membrane protease YdiL (CAAX protease family)
MGLTLLILEITIIISTACGVHEIQRHTILELLSQNPPFRDKLMMSLTAAIGAPLQEDFIFRGVLQTFIIGLIFQEFQRRKRSSPDEALSQHHAVWARWLGILAASGIFALMHLPNWQHLPALFVLGMCLGYFYVRYGNLLIPIFVHSMFNILPLAYMMWQVGPRTL